MTARIVQRYSRSFALGASIGLVTLIFIAIGRFAKLAPGDWGTWTGGVGTVGTLLFAIYIAGEGERRRRAEQMDLARIVAAEFWLTLPGIISDVEAIKNGLRHNEGMIGISAIASFADKLKAMPSWESEKLASLVCFPNHVAAKLAMASTERQMCVSDLLDLYSRIRQISDDHRKAAANEIAMSLECIEGYLRDAYAQCDAALITRVV